MFCQQFTKIALSLSNPIPCPPFRASTTPSRFQLDSEFVKSQSIRRKKNLSHQKFVPLNTTQTHKRKQLKGGEGRTARRNGDDKRDDDRRSVMMLSPSLCQLTALQFSGTGISSVQWLESQTTTGNTLPGHWSWRFPQILSKEIPYKNITHTLRETTPNWKSSEGTPKKKVPNFTHHS